MSSPVNTVSVDGWDISGHDESAADMMEGLQGPDTEEGGPEPRVKVDRGQKVEVEEPDPISDAASKLGKKGGEAAAKAKAKAAREAKKEADDEGAEAGRKAVPDAKAEVAEPDGEEVAAEDKRKGNPRHDTQARIRELAEERREARERAERAEREASEYRYRLERAERERSHPAQEQRQAAPQAQDAEPRLEDFLAENADYTAGVEAFTKAHNKWNREQWTRETAEAYRAESQRAAYVKFVTEQGDAFKAAMWKAREADADLPNRIKPELMQLRPTWDLTPEERPYVNSWNWIADELVSAPDLAPGRLLYLTERPDELQRIVALSSPRAVTRELTMISVKLSDAATAGTSSERRVSKAKPPVTPVTGSPNTADDDLSDEDDYDTHVRKMNARERRARR